MQAETELNSETQVRKLEGQFSVKSADEKRNVLIDADGYRGYKEDCCHIYIRADSTSLSFNVHVNIGVFDDLARQWLTARGYTVTEADQ